MGVVEVVGDGRGEGGVVVVGGVGHGGDLGWLVPVV